MAPSHCQLFTLFTLATSTRRAQARGGGSLRGSRARTLNPAALDRERERRGDDDGGGHVACAGWRARGTDLLSGTLENICGVVPRFGREGGGVAGAGTERQTAWSLRDENRAQTRADTRAARGRRPGPGFEPVSARCVVVAPTRRKGDEER